MNLTDLIKDPWFGLSIALISIIIGIVANRYYYEKGKKEGEKSVNEQKKLLEKANAKIAALQLQLNKFGSTGSEILKQSGETGTDARDIKQILTARNNTAKHEKDILHQVEVLLDNGKVREARNFYEGSKHKIEHPGMRHFIPGRILQEEGQFDNALAEFSQAFIYEHDDVNKIAICNIKGGIYFTKLHNFRMALKEWNQALNFGGLEARTLINIACCYVQLNEYVIAETKFKDVIGQYPDFPDSYFDLGQLYNELKKPDQAIECCRKALALGAASELVYRIMGNAYTIKEDYQEATKYFAKALEASTIDISKHEIHIAQIHTYKLMGDLVAAENICNVALKNFPGDLPLMGLYFDVLNDMGKFQRVLDLGLKMDLRDLSYYSAVINYNIGRAHLLKLEYQLAIARFELVRSHMPDEMMNLHYLAECYAKKTPPELEKGLQIRLKIIELGGETPDYLGWTGIFLMELQRYDEAIEYFNKVLAIDPGNQHATYNRSMASNLRLTKLGRV